MQRRTPIEIFSNKPGQCVVASIALLFNVNCYLYGGKSSGGDHGHNPSNEISIYFNRAISEIDQAVRAVTKYC